MMYFLFMVGFQLGTIAAAAFLVGFFGYTGYKTARKLLG